MYFYDFGGCTSLNHSEKLDRDNTIVVPQNWENAQEYVNTALSQQLLDLVNSKELSALVIDTIENNHDLKSTALRLEQASLLDAQSGRYQEPTLTSSYQASRNKTGSITSNQRISLDLSWELDVWGRLSDTSDSASAKAKASELDYIYAKNSLVARVIQAWLDVVYRAKIIDVESRWIASLSKTEGIVAEQVLDGLKEQADLDTARAETYRIRAALASREQQQLAAIRRLNVLRGKVGQHLDFSTIDTPEIESPPLTLPGDMLASRPDLLAAYQTVIAADKDTSIAYKDLLPKLTLTSSVYKAGSSSNQLVDNPSLWSLVGGITAPIFNQGNLETQAKIAELKANVAFINYQKKLLNAMTEVGIALDQEYYLNQQEQHYQDAHIYSISSMKNYQNLYQEGASDVLALLIAQRSIYQSKIQLIQTQQARFSNRISLGLALGMGI